MIDWAEPVWLLALWIVPVVALLLLSAARWRTRAAETFAAAPMLRRLAPEPDGTRRVLKVVLASVALTCLLVAIARPRYGTYMQDISTSGADLCILLDVSRSMLAEDVKPNRLDRAKSDILDLASRLQGDRIGLVVYAGTPVLKVPLTTDVDFFRTELAEIGTNVAPSGGSRIGNAILKALECMESRFDRQQVIVLISDGEDQDSFPEEAAKVAAERDVQIITVGLGDAIDGARIPVRSASGGLSYLQYGDQEVWSVLREETLKGLAEITGGAYIPAGTSVYDLGDIYENHLSAITRAKTDVQRRRRLHERFQLFAAVAFFCLIAEGLVSIFRTPQKTARQLAVTPASAD